MNRSMSHVDAIFNDHSKTCNLDGISVPILNHRGIIVIILQCTYTKPQGDNCDYITVDIY